MTRTASDVYAQCMTTTLGMARPRGDLRVFLASEIRAAMSRENLSGVRLASIIGKSQPYVSRRLSGRLAFDVDDLEVISRVLGVSPSELMNDAVRRLDEAILKAKVERYGPADDGGLHTVPANGEFNRAANR